MSTIKISDLHPTGYDLFSDSEGYMNELGDSELDIINGGVFTTPVCAVSAVITISIAVASHVWLLTHAFNAPRR